MKIPPKISHLHQTERESAPPPHLVSVCVSLFNYERFLPSCLDSVLGQLHPELELIIVDDASGKDDSAQAAVEWTRKHAHRFHRTVVIRHEHNQGLAEARNTGFREARGNHVFVLDADNEIYPRAVGRLLETARNLDCAAVYSQLEFFGDEQRLGFADVWDKRHFVNGNYVDAMALIARDAWARVGGYSHLEGGWEDFDFWCKLIDDNLEATYVPEVLCRYRVHGSSMLRTDTHRAHERLAIEMISRHPWLRFGTGD